jgi:DNA-binding NtrC family response regulator
MSTIPPDPRSTVVVVEDEFLVRENAVCELEEVGFRVIECASADEALAFLSAHPGEANAVFTDVQMPGRLSGLDLADIVSRTWPHIGVLVTSGGSVVDPATLPRCARFVPKPWRGRDVVSRLTQLARGPREYLAWPAEQVAR